MRFPEFHFNSLRRAQHTHNTVEVFDKRPGRCNTAQGVLPGFSQSEISSVFTDNRIPVFLYFLLRFLYFGLGQGNSVDNSLVKVLTKLTFCHIIFVKFKVSRFI